MRVLCIDDDPSILTLHKVLLESKGFDVVLASSGDEGLRMFDQHPVHAVIVDYVMPPKGGLVVASQIKQASPKVPIIMCSGRRGWDCRSCGRLHREIIGPQHFN